MTTLQRRTGIALWRQVADQIRQTVLINMSANERLPAESELASRFHVNRHTVRAAIAALEKEGILRAEQGRGTFLNDRKKLRYPIGKRTRFSSGLQNQAQTRTGKLISSQIRPATPLIAHSLELAVHTAVVELFTVSSADNVPVSIATSWLDASRFSQLPDIYRETGSVTQSLARLGVEDYTRKSTAVEARHANTQDLDLLSLSPGAIVLVTRAINIDANNRPIQYGETRFAADRVELVIASNS